MESKTHIFPREGQQQRNGFRTWIQSSVGRCLPCTHGSILSTTENKQKHKFSMVVHTLISAFRKPRQEDSYEFKTSRVYTANTSPARTTEWDPVF